MEDTNIGNDPAEWHIANKHLIIDLILKNPPQQNIDKLDFTISARNYGKFNRYANKQIFFSNCFNEERHRREWLLYSETTGKVFCIYTKLFDMNSENAFVSGFNDWKNHIRIDSHEISMEHKNNAKAFIMRTQNSGKIDSELHRQYLAVRDYWK